jgi:hypothetical protein
VRDQRHAPAALYPRERPGTHCTGGWVGPRAGLDRCGKSHPSPGFDPRTVQPVASHNLYDIYLLLCVQCTPDDGQRNYPKHVEFYSKNKFEKLVHLVGFIIRIYHDAQSSEMSNPFRSVHCQHYCSHILLYHIPFTSKCWGLPAPPALALKILHTAHTVSLWVSGDSHNKLFPQLLTILSF